MTEHYTLLTIDDEEPIRRSIRVYFEDEGFKVIEAEDGLEGLAVFREKRPAAVLVDLRMPGMSGLEVIESLARDAPEVPVVVLSGTGFIGDAIEAIRKGAWDYVTKPILDMAELEHAVRNALERARLREEGRHYHERLEQEVALATESLRASEERYRVLTENSLTGIFIFQDEKLAYANRRFAKTLGYTTDEVIGRSVWDFVAQEDQGWAKQTVSDRLKGLRIPGQFEIRALRKNGERIHAEVMASLAEYRGRPAIMGNIMDITERKLAEEKRKKYAHDLEFLSKAAMGFVEVSPNEDIYEFVGNKLNQLASNSIVIVNSYDKATHRFCARSVQGLGEIGHRVLEILGKDPVGMEVVLNDEKARAELLKGTLGKGPEGLHQLSFGAVPVGVCKVVEKLIGLDAILAIGLARGGELLGSAVLITRQPHAADALLADKDLVETFISQASIALQRRDAEVSLAESRERFRDLVENMNEAVFAVNRDGKYTYVSPVMEGITGYTPGEMIGHDCTEFFVAEDVPAALECAQHTMMGDAAVREIRMVHRSGEVRWVRASNRPIVKDGDVAGIQGMMMDVTARKTAEGELERRAEELSVLNRLAREIGADLLLQSAVSTALKHIMEGIHPDVVMVFLREGEELHLRGVAPEEHSHAKGTLPIHRVGDCLCGLAVQERRMICSMNIHSDPRCTLEECKKAGFRSFAALPLLSGGEIVGVLGVASASERDFQEQAAFLEAMAGEIAMGLRNASLFEKAQRDAIELLARLNRIKDAEAEREKLTLQLQQAQKMEAIGTLAGGIAHDFNNILTPIIMGAELALMDMPVENKAHPLLQKILEAGVRAKDLVQQILTFSRQSDLERASLKFVPILKETIKLARSALPSTIEIRQDIHLETDTILANPTQVHQVMMNLFTNAGHAMRENGGMLEIVSRAEHLAEPSLAGLPNLTPGDFLRVSVRDTGHGMDRRTMDKIFDPFFTTKTRGEGTGLGLSIVHGIVTGCNGAIQVNSRVGEGTTFTLYFPLEKTGEKQRMEKRKPIPKGSGKILLVDDEPDIAEIYSGMLRHLGYTVVAKTSSLDALETFRDDPLAFDLLMTDMTMPRLTGDKLAAEVMRIRPEIPVILCTGFSERMEEGRAAALGIRAFLKKPITVEDAANKIRMALDRKKE